MKQTVPCSYDKECKAQISVRPLIEGVENPIPLVNLPLYRIILTTDVDWPKEETN